jgi:hypothetical protein
MALQDHYKSNYGAWAGNINGNKADFQRCCEEVYSSERGWSRFSQCARKNGYGPDGAYCKIHDPAYVEAKTKAREDKWATEREISRLKYQLQSAAPIMLDIIRQIAKGHNDPRQICAAFLREKQLEEE